jgi:hypothetical protein
MGIKNKTLVMTTGNLLCKGKNTAKSCIFLAREKTCMVWGIFLHPCTEPAPKDGFKIFLRHLTTTLVPSLILQISYIVQSSLESPTLEFFAYHLPYSRSRCLVTWQSPTLWGSDGTRVVGKWHKNFLIPCFGANCIWGWRNIPQTVRN